MSANKTVYYTQINEEEFEHTWVISNWPASWNRKDTQVSSPIYNVGSNNQLQFQLKFSEIYEWDAGHIAELWLYCLKGNTELPCKYTILVIKDGQSVNTYSNDCTYRKPFESGRIFRVRIEELKKFISSTGDLIFRCEFSLFTNKHKKSLNCEPVKTHEAPKRQLPKFDSVFLNEKFSDVLLRTSRGKEIPAHRVVLATASPVFDAMFSHAMLENKSQSVDMVDITYETAIEMLRYMYTGGVETREISLTIELLAAADKYQLEDLKNECEKILSSKMSSKNAVDILQVADKYSMKSLKKQAVDFVKHNINQSSNSDEVGSMILSMAQFLSK
ncbi:speckle-type POZ protein A-like [Trichogramma pretiosum]|uniref:speckle-type POZ protein A-like n=1 Tax=Trichogramma pretiosum TaxID=7493 RepID=UPI0006C9CCDE|nr:speckle-type POZ protein A-like [Trichogramma pretiosum]